MRTAAKVVATVAVLAGLVVPSPAGSASPAPVRVVGPSACSDGPAAGETVIRTSDDRRHRFYWRVPATPAPATGRPVLIWLHGDGGTGVAMAPQFWPSTDPDGAIVVTPDGTRQTWNHRADDDRGPLDSQFIERLIDLLISCESVDADRIFVGGVSRGAYMPYYLLQRAGTRNKIAAVAVDAGLLYCKRRDTCEAEGSRRVLHGADARILHLHGTNDRTVAPPPTARYHRPVNWNVDWRVFNPMRLWAQQHGCWTDQVGGPNNGRLRETYQIAGRDAKVYDLTGHGAACAAYQLILVRRGGHVIYGQEARIWAFLMDRPFAEPPS